MLAVSRPIAEHLADAALAPPLAATRQTRRPTQSCASTPGVCRFPVPRPSAKTVGAGGSGPHGSWPEADRCVRRHVVAYDPYSHTQWRSWASNCCPGRSAGPRRFHPGAPTETPETAIDRQGGAGEDRRASSSSTPRGGADEAALATRSAVSRAGGLAPACSPMVIDSLRCLRLAQVSPIRASTAEAQTGTDVAESAGPGRGRCARRGQRRRGSGQRGGALADLRKRPVCCWRCCPTNCRCRCRSSSAVSWPPKRLPSAPFGAARRLFGRSRCGDICQRTGIGRLGGVTAEIWQPRKPRNHRSVVDVRAARTVRCGDRLGSRRAPAVGKIVQINGRQF